MQGYRFYREAASPADKRAGRTIGTVFAVFVPEQVTYGPAGACVAGIGGVYDRPDSPVCGTDAAVAYLRTHCTRISEAEARALHPALFTVLDHEGV